MSFRVWVVKLESSLPESLLKPEVFKQMYQPGTGYKLLKHLQVLLCLFQKQPSRMEQESVAIT
jgi:hypothetical protein